MVKKSENQYKSPQQEEAERIAFDTIQCAIAPVDKLAEEADRRWGTDKLVSLVQPELAGKFGRARALLNSAIRERKPQDVVRLADNMVRAYRVLDQTARDAGHKPQPPEVIHVKDDDSRSWRVVVDRDMYNSVIGEGSDPIKTVTLHELLAAYQIVRDRSGGLVDDVRRAYPGATVRQPVSADEHDDDIPF